MLDSDTDIFLTVAGVFDAVILFLSISWLNYALRTSEDQIKENIFICKRHETDDITKTKTIMDVDNVDDLALLVNPPSQAEYLLNSKRHCLLREIKWNRFQFF